MRLPDFFIVGAPKCGTTALYSYLRGHPDIYMPDVKEPHYFGSDLQFRYKRRPDLSLYASYFNGATDGKIAGEASVWYLYSEMAAAEIRRAVPDARAIAMVRNPVDMIASLHSQLVYNAHEDLPLAEALAAEPERAQGREIPSTTDLPDSLLYRHVASFAEQLERYFNELGRDRVHVILYDDFKTDTAACFRGVLTFLGVDTTYRPRLDVVNANKVSRNMVFRRFLNTPPEWLRSPARALMPPAARRRLYQRLVTANTKAARRDPVPRDVDHQLRIEMAPSVMRLSRLLDRDLGAWLPTQQPV
jgi:hypothetical protein